MKTVLILFISMFVIGIFTGAAPAYELAGVEIHGFVSQGYLVTDDNNYLADTEGEGTFQFNEIGINLSKDLTDSLHLALQIFSRDLGDVANNDVVLGYAYGDYRWKDWLGLRAGKIKIDYGLYNETREMDMLRTSILLPQSVYPEVWRDSFSNINGGALYGYIPGGFLGKFAYDFQIGAMEFDEDGGFAQSFTPMLNEDLDLSGMNADYAWFANLQWHTPLPGLKIKGTYYRIEGLTAEGDLSLTTMEGDTIESDVTYDVTPKSGFVISSEYAWKNLTLTAEYAEDDYKFERTLELDEDFFPMGEGESPEGGGLPKSPRMTSQGWYVSASYRFTDWLESALRYSEYYPDKDDRGGDKLPPNEAFTAWLKTTTLSTRFDINDYWVFKLEASYNDGFGGINLAENDHEDLDPNWWLLAAKVTFSF